MSNSVYKKNNKGFDINVTIYENDGVTPRNLTGLTLTYQLKDKITPTITKTISGTIVDAPTGRVKFTVPNAFFDVVTTYTGEINLIGTNYEEDTETFLVTVLEQQA